MLIQKTRHYLPFTLNLLQTCPGRCLELRDCVQCQVHNAGPLTEEECASNCTFVPAIVEGTLEGELTKRAPQKR